MGDSNKVVNVVVATNNKGKIPEIVDRLDMDGWSYHTLSDYGIVSDPDETGTTYEENARIKVMSVREFAKDVAVLADDSGLEVLALNGEPGIHSARYSGEDANDQDNINKLLVNMNDLADGQREARFVCTIVFVDEAGHEFVGHGECRGSIAHKPQGDGGFGYDPIFFPDEIADGRTMAELSPEEKNSISHRGKALNDLRRQLIRRRDGGNNGNINNNDNNNDDAQVKIVAFDFDDTVLEGHSPVYMIRKLVIKGVISPLVALKTTWWGIRYKLHIPVEQASVRKYVYKGFSHFAADEADRIMAEFYKEELRHRLRPKAIETINMHKSEGAKVVIVSASFYPIIKEAAADIGADHFMCTEMESENGYYTGNVCGEPPEGKQKLIQLTNWADAAFGHDNWQLVAAYGDHRSDRYILGAAKNPVAVNPDSGLDHMRKKWGWETVDWSFKPE